MATLNRDGVDLVYEVEGSGAQPMVFVHGWACNRRYLSAQIRYFVEQGCTTVSLDLRGHGQSRAQEGTSFTIADFAGDVAALIDHLGLDLPVAVGHSMGGITVLQLAADHPASVSAIVMIDPASLVRNPRSLAVRVEMLEAMRAGDQGPQRAFVDRFMFLETDDPARKEEIIAGMLSTPVNVSVAAMESIHAFDGPAVAAKCRVPALHIGSARPLNPINQFEQHLEGVVSGQTVGAGHFNQILVPGQVNDMIDRFLNLHVWPRPRD
jgi:pimeloyl-ACP methyl ester carboxylesterase